MEVKQYNTILDRVFCFWMFLKCYNVAVLKKQYIVLFCDLKHKMYGLDETKRN